jgi:pimeloyl-ACP methyl ester carboxylesterase
LTPGSIHRACGLAAAAALFAAAPPFAAAAPAAPAQAPTYLTLQELRARYGEAGARTTTIQGVEVYYKDEGSGPAILMVHGSLSTLRTYDGVAARLKDRYRIIRYDIPPLGLSGPVPDAVAQAHVRPEAVAAELLDRLGVKSVTAVGVSSGGTMVSFLAAARPELVERLIIANAPSDPVNTAPMKLSAALAREEALPGGGAQGGYKRRAFWDAFFDFFAGEPERISPALRDEYYDINRRVPERNSVALTAIVADNAFTRAALGKVTCPVLHA